MEKFIKNFGVKFIYLILYIPKVRICRGEEVEDLDGMVMDGQDGQHGQDGEEEIHIHSAGVFHGCLEDGGECHGWAGLTIHGGGDKCHLVWVLMAG